MACTLLIIAAIFASLCNGVDVGVKARYEGHQVWRINPQNEEDLKFLRKLSLSSPQLDFWKDPVAIGRSVDVRIPPNFLIELSETFQSRKLEYVVNIENVQELIDNEKAQIAKSDRATSLEDFNYGTYHTADEIYQWMTWIEEEYSFITKLQVGTTYEGRPIYALEISKSDSGPKIYYDSLIHCREWVTAATSLWTLNAMLTDPAWQHMIDDFNWYYIPMINVDGYVETWTGDRLWRKTRSTGPSSICVGTDGNRNWAEPHWSGDGASGNPCTATYYGPYPASESEVRHLQNYILGKGDVDAFLSVHSYSQLIMYPYAWGYDLVPENDVLNVTAKNQHDAVYDVHQKEYEYGPVASTIYVSAGTSVDWGYINAGIKYSFTWELRDEGRYGFELPADQIIPNGEEFIAGLNALIQDVKNSL